MTAMAKLLAAEIVLLVTQAAAIGSTVQFVQDGWDQGGPLDVMFSGTDVNANGSIDGEELVAFNAVFVLPQGGTTSWTMPDIAPGGFLFESSRDFLLFLSNAQYSLVDTAFDGETLGSVFDTNLFPVATTSAQASVVPEPNTFALISSGLACAASLSLRRRWPVIGRMKDRS